MTVKEVSKNWVGICCAGLLLLGACHEKNKNKMSPAELMKTREIKKVSEGEILKKGGELGNEILRSVQEITSVRINADSVECETNNWVELDALKETYQTDIQRVNGETKGNTDLELQLLSAYQYNLENQLEPTASVQKLDAKTVLFAYPIAPESNIYSYCLDSADRKRAEMWSLKISIKEIINRL